MNITLGALALTLGCGGESGGRDATTGTSLGTATASGSATATASTTDASASGTDSDSGSDTDATTTTTSAGTGTFFDVGDGTASDTAAETGSGEGCSKVDFLFVIDNSGSMGDEQDSLIASFPGFIQTIQDTLTEAQDYHIMVTDTDANWGGDCKMLCPLFGNVCPDIPNYPCMAGAPSPCDEQLGAGINYPLGDDATNMFCSFSSGQRYMDETEPDLAASFQCAAKVGTDGDSGEMPMSAMVAALGTQHNQAGGCNEGFIRDDAILVVTIITDEEDDDSTGTPDGWFANVVASKSGDASAIVMLGLINDTDAAMPVCDPMVQDPVKVRSFIDMFPNSIRGSVCEPSYNAFFDQAVSLIDTTCSDFVPPG